MNTNDNNFCGDDEEFPWEDIVASRQDARMQAKKNAHRAQKQYGSKATCPKCARQGKDLTWFYFCSPAWTWEHWCGRAGWIAVCDSCQEQVLFICEVLN